MVEGIFSWVDLIMGPLYLILLYGLAYTIMNKKYKDPSLRKHFMWGFTVKIIGCLGFVAVYAFYYKGGDTFAYFRDTIKIFSILGDDPWKLDTILFSKELDHLTQIYLDPYTYFHRSDGNATYLVIRFAVFFGLFTFNSYLATSFCFAFVSFLGVWCLYRTVSYIFPKYYTYVAIPVLYFPSVFFWGSSIMKDSIVIGFIGFMTYALYQLFFTQKKIVLNILLLAICLYVLSNVKQYVIITYFPALILWLSLGPISRMKFKYKMVMAPLTLLIGGLLLYSLIPMLEKISSRYTLEKVIESAELTSEYIYRSTREGGSVYSLGNVQYTPIGMVKVFPKAVAVSLYRPFLWEAKNPVMLISALESTLVLLTTLFVLIRVGLIKYFGYIFKNPFLMACFIFSIFFAFAIGISTYNFGSLVRYKIPCLPMYGIAIIIPYVALVLDKDNQDL